MRAPSALALRASSRARTVLPVPAGPSIRARWLTPSSPSMTSSCSSVKRRICCIRRCRIVDVAGRKCTSGRRIPRMRSQSAWDGLGDEGSNQRAWSARATWSRARNITASSRLSSLSRSRSSLVTSCHECQSPVDARIAGEQAVKTTADQNRTRDAAGNALETLFLMLRAAISACRKGPR